MHNKSMNPTVKRLRQRQVRKIMITPMQPCNFLGFPFYRLAVITAISLEPIGSFYFLRKSYPFAYITVSNDQSRKEISRSDN